MDIADVVAPADQTLTLRGLRMHYPDWGDDQPSPVLLLHGGGLTAH